MTPRTPKEQRIGLRDAAERLGVHYMTAYRYVRLGQLPAVKEGGEWKVLLSDVERLHSAPTTPRGAGGANWDHYQDQLLSRLRSGDEAGAFAIVERALGSGAAPRDIHIELVGPVLRRIGAMWADGDIDVAEEHRASAVATRIIGRLGPSFSRPGRKKATVVVGAAPGDRHSLPTAMLADILRGEGLEVVDLGGDSPAESFVQTVRDQDGVVAIAVSVGADQSREAAAEVARLMHAEAPGVAVFIGGPAIPDEATARGLGADEYGAGALEVAQRCLELATHGPGNDAVAR